MRSSPAKSIFELSAPEKLQLVEDLWDDIASDPASVPVHEWQIKELERRRENLLKNPDSGLTWQEVQARIRKHNDR